MQSLSYFAVVLLLAGFYLGTLLDSGGNSGTKTTVSGTGEIVVYRISLQHHWGK